MKSINIIIGIGLAFILSFTSTTSVSAAECYKISSVDGGNANVSLRYLEQTDSTSLVYAIFTLPEEESGAVLVNVPGNLYVTNGEMNYKFLAAHNVPVQDESLLEYSILEGQDRKLNFILEFELFPIDEKFDIVDESSEKEGLNFKGVCVDVSSTNTVDAKRFMKSTSLPRYGTFYDEGNSISYYERDGVLVSCHSTYGDDNFKVYLSVINNSNHGVLFNTGNVTVKGHKPNGKGSMEVDLPVLTKNEYVSLIAAADRYEAEKQTGSHGLFEAGSIVSLASIGTPFRSLERSGLSILSGILIDANRNLTKPYLAELDKTREERTKNYLVSQSLKSGDSHSGFLIVERPKKVNDWLVTLHMDDYDFVFYYNID